jgi:hypothetical protein
MVVAVTPDPGSGRTFKVVKSFGWRTIVRQLRDA